MDGSGTDRHATPKLNLCQAEYAGVHTVNLPVESSLTLLTRTHDPLARETSAVRLVPQAGPHVHFAEQIGTCTRQLGGCSRRHLMTLLRKTRIKAAKRVRELAAGLSDPTHRKALEE